MGQVDIQVSKLDMVDLKLNIRVWGSGYIFEDGFMLLQFVILYSNQLDLNTSTFKLLWNGDGLISIDRFRVILIVDIVEVGFHVLLGAYLIKIINDYT